MTRRFRSGLVVGKFAPLHLGHQHLIERAIDECEEVTVVSYCKPEIPGCLADRRDAWFAELYPSARRHIFSEPDLAAWRPDLVMPDDDAPGIEHHHFIHRLCSETWGITPDAVFTSEEYGEPFARNLTRFRLEHDATAPAVMHVPVDPARTAVPISASAIRSDVHANRRWLSPVVYADFVERICILGGESSGKSTLAAGLAKEFGTEYVEEYARALWMERGGQLTSSDLLHIGERQTELEELAARRAHRFLFCDTSPLTTLFYSREMFGKADAALEKLAERPYSLAVLCAPDFPFVQDGTRREPGFREQQHAWYLAELQWRRMPWILAAGPLEARIAALRSILPAPRPGA